MKIRYIQPCEDCPNGFEEVEVSKEEAIRIQKETAARVRPGFVYSDDETALLDYIAVNWADVLPD